MNNLNTSLFEEEETFEKHNNLDIIKLEYQSNYLSNWHDLFDGFSTLHAITFSSQTSFLVQLIKKFEYVEIIFGNETVISSDIEQIMAYQHRVIEEIASQNSKTKEYFYSRIREGSLKFYVAKKKLSHEKIYLLSNETDYKVVTGSANLSYSAFSGLQSETIQVIENFEGYSYFLNRYETLKSSSTNEITEKVIKTFNVNFVENFENTPFIEEAKVLKIIEKTQENSNDVKFSFDILKNAELLKKYMPSENKQPYISVNNLIPHIKRIRNMFATQNVDTIDQLPSLIIDTEHKQVYFQDKLLDLNPSKDEIRSDIELFIQFLNGYKHFNGTKNDIEMTLEKYYSFASWMFASPFLSNLRFLAYKFNKKIDPFPMFGIIYGNSKAGKTSFLSSLLLFMIGDDPKLPAIEFKATAINHIRNTVKGIPIIYDDMVSAKFNINAVPVIKNDMFGLNPPLTNYPVVVISANEDVKVVQPEIQRRIVTCRTNIGLDTTDAMKRNPLNLLRKKVSNAFFRAYLGKFLEGYDDFINPLFDENKDDYIDVFEYSSSILKEMIIEHIENVPEYVKVYALEDYFSEKRTSLFAIRHIKEAYQNNKKNFDVDKKNNKLTYSNPDFHELRRIKSELPDSLGAKLMGQSLSMELNKAKAFFEIDFKRTLF